MNSFAWYRVTHKAGLATLFLLLGGCTGREDGPAAPDSPGPLVAAKAAPGITVTAADPPFGHQGEAGKQVRVLGSGFLNGDQASWQRNGVADPKIHVQSTQFVSTTELRATINIDGDASLAFYDIAVLSAGRKGGIGTTLFEVTQATLIAGTEIAYGVNDNGEAAGRVGVPGAFFSSPSTGLDTLGSPGRAFDISDNGQTVVGGFTFNGSDAEAFVYDFVGGAWQRTLLTRTYPNWATAQAVASDPSTGAAVLVGGVEATPQQESKLQRMPRIWTLAGGVWTRSLLPRSASGDDVVKDVTATGVAAGISDVGGRNERAAVWEPNGVGGWTLTVIGQSNSKAHGINSAGTIIVGEQGGVAVLWQRTGGSWGSAIPLPGDCDYAIAVDDLDRIAANGCTTKGAPVVFLPPYSTATWVILGGLGDATGGGTTIEGMSRQGGYLVGQARYKNTGVGVSWHPF